MILKQNTCCFTGHRKLPQKKIQRIVKRLNEEIDQLINQGITNFISGGAVGFDLIAASMVVAKKEMGAKIKLIFALPWRNQDEHWSDKEKDLYRSLLSEADEVRYISEEYNPDCMKKRNHYMVDNSEYCICAFIHRGSGTAQTARYAEQKGLHIINVAK